MFHLHKNGEAPTVERALPYIKAVFYGSFSLLAATLIYGALTTNPVTETPLNQTGRAGNGG